MPNVEGNADRPNTLRQQSPVSIRAGGDLRGGRRTDKGSRFFREHGLAIVWLGMFLVTFGFGQIATGYLQFNEDQRAHGHQEIKLTEYFATAHFVEATMENWESEFLQMFLFVALTGCLKQKGSAASKKLEGMDDVDRDPRLSQDKSRAPWPVRQGGLILKVYENSLSLAFLVLFLISFCLHAAGGARLYNQDQQDHGDPKRVTTFTYMKTSRFWFESFQNWQSEFLAVGAMVVLSIWLRQKGSPESKPVDAPHDQTGKD